MTWTFWMPNAPTNLTGSLVAGGTLDINTTYYFKVFAWDIGNTNTTRGGLTQGSAQIYSPYSATFSITTDSTNRSVALTWDMSLKRNGVTQVDGYEVLCSKSDNFDTANDKTAFSPVSYYNVATLTNSYTVVNKPSTLVKNTHLGLPLMEWDGASSTSFASLYAALMADPTYNIFVKTIGSYWDSTDIYGYHFMGRIVINKWAGDSTAGQYSFISTGDMVVVNGQVYVAPMKYKIENTFLVVNGTSHHCISISNPLSGSIVRGNFFRGGFRSYVNKSYSSAASGASSLAGTYAGSLVSTNINQITENSGESVTGDSTFIETAWYSGAANGAWSLTMPRLDSRNNSLSSYISQALSGKPKKIYYTDPYLTTYPSGFYWSTEVNFSATTSGISTVGQYYATGGYDMRFIYPDRDGWDVFLWGIKKNDTFRLGKTVRVTVLDMDKNPIEGAKVSFLSNSGVNLTKGNSATTIASVFAGNSSVENYEAAETVLHHDDPWIITQNRASYGYASLKENTNYWFRGEKIGVGTKSATAEPYNAAYYRYTAERGLDGTPTGWNLGNTTNADLFFEALDYVETDSNGFTFNQVNCKIYKGIASSSSNMISTLLTAGDITETDYFPIEIKVEANGYVTKSTFLDETTAINAGITPINLIVTLEKQVPLLQTLDGEKMLLNLSPEKAVNDSEYVEVE